MNSIREAIQLLIQQSKKPVPEVFKPLRDVGSVLHKEGQAIMPNSTPEQWRGMTTSQKALSLGKQGLGIAEQGVGQIPEAIANSFSVSPPGQLAQYAMGNPDPKKQAQHGIQAALAALALGGYLKTPVQSKEYIRNAVGQFAPKPVRIVTELMGGIR